MTMMMMMIIIIIIIIIITEQPNGIECSLKTCYSADQTFLTFKELKGSTHCEILSFLSVVNP